MDYIWNNGKENGNYYRILEFRVILGLGMLKTSLYMVL